MAQQQEVLVKRSHYLNSVSLSVLEFKALAEGKYSAIHMVRAGSGEVVKKKPLPNKKTIDRLIARSSYSQTKHQDADGETRPSEEQAGFFIVNI